MTVPDSVAIVHKGRCHCGALSVEFHSDKPFAPRACGCSFCRKHSAISVSDPDGRAIIRHARNRAPLAYRFGLKTADFLICPTCGVYVGAVIEIGGRLYSVVNLNIFENVDVPAAATPMSYDAESTEDRIGRREKVWTPTSIEERSEG
jgi:hypothetical protein